MAVETVSPTRSTNDALHALCEAQRMSEGAQFLVDQLIEESAGDIRLYPRLQAVRACLLQLDAAVDPAVDQLGDEAHPA